MYCVITTINKPTKAIDELYKRFQNKLLIIGDKKTPRDWNYYGLVPYMASLAEYAPDNSYARKNMGYMVAIANGAKLIYDTDDDNIPNEQWKVRGNKTAACVSNSKGWHNVYIHFTNKNIWPRGFPLNHVNGLASFDGRYEVNSSIQQGLANEDPDVDAIWRMTNRQRITFPYDRSIYLDQFTWCPFNSQSTWWFPKAYPLMYLPQYCTMRCTDIWRSFIAQRCLWELGEGVTFHSPAEVYQERNEHDLMKDFQDEIPGYLLNEKICAILEGLTLSGSVCENLLSCYVALVENSILPNKEIDSVISWIKDYENATRNIPET